MDLYIYLLFAVYLQTKAADKYQLQTGVVMYFVIICSICSLQSLNNALGQNEHIKITRYKACPSESSHCWHCVNLEHVLVFVDCQSNSSLLEAKTWKMRAISACVGNCIHALTYIILYFVCQTKHELWNKHVQDYWGSD